MPAWISQAGMESHGGMAELPILVGESEQRLYPLSAETIDYIESDRNYVIIHTGATTYGSRDSIKRLSADLAGLGFVRIGRSLLVNIRAVSCVEPLGRGAFKFTLSSGTYLRSGSSYRRAVLDALPRRGQARAPQ
jgi:DNA-binding LytR/AlgR family response regulator